MTEAVKTKAKRGFALWDKDKLSETSRKGGSSTAPEKRAFSKDPDLAREAAKLGARVRNAQRSSGGS